MGGTGWLAQLALIAAVALQREDWLALGTEPSSAELELPTIFDHPSPSAYASELEGHRNAVGTVPLDNLAITAPTTTRCDQPMSSLSLPVDEEDQLGRFGQLGGRLVSPSSSRLVEFESFGEPFGHGERSAYWYLPHCNRTQAPVFAGVSSALFCCQPTRRLTSMVSAAL